MRASSTRASALASVFLALGLLALPVRAESTVFGARDVDPTNADLRLLRYSVTITNPGSENVTDLTCWVATPLPSAAAQTRVRLETTYPAELVADSFGNQALCFHVRRLAPYDTIIVRITASLLNTGPPRMPSRPEAFLAAQPMIEADDPEIQRRAALLHQSSRYETARAVYDWTRRTIRRGPFSEVDQGARGTMASRIGDCTDMAYVFAALCRAAGVPARVMAGYICPRSRVVHPAEYHNWAEFLDGGTWHVVDPDVGVFDDAKAGHIATNVIPSEEGYPLGENHRFRCSRSDITVTMD